MFRGIFNKNLRHLSLIGIKARKSRFLNVSDGNKDRQTDRGTHGQTKRWADRRADVYTLEIIEELRN